MTTANDIIIGALWPAGRARANERARAWRSANREKVRQSQRAYRAANIEKVRAWERARVRLRNPEAEKERKRAYAGANREKVRERNRAWRKANLERARGNERRSKGLPIPQRPAPDSCECCGGPPGKKGLAIDHCHETGAFRGWLCTNCNTGIGKLGDDIAGVVRAVEYLTKVAKGQMT